MYYLADFKTRWDKEIEKNPKWKERYGGSSERLRDALEKGNKEEYVYRRQMKDIYRSKNIASKTNKIDMFRRNYFNKGKSSFRFIDADDIKTKERLKRLETLREKYGNTNINDNIYLDQILSKQKKKGLPLSANAELNQRKDTLSEVANRLDDQYEKSSKNYKSYLEKPKKVKEVVSKAQTKQGMSLGKKALIGTAGIAGLGAVAYGLNQLRKSRSDKGRKRGKYRGAF